MTQWLMTGRLAQGVVGSVVIRTYQRILQITTNYGNATHFLICYIVLLKVLEARLDILWYFPLCSCLECIIKHLQLIIK